MAGWPPRCNAVRARICFQLRLRQVFDDLGDEGARPGGRVENFHALVAKSLAEMLVAQVVGALDHKAHDLLGV